MGVWMLAGLALSVPFIGKPTYLGCDFPAPDKAAAITVAIDRSHRAVTFTQLSSGRVERHRAAVSGPTISFDSPLAYGNVNYAIDRSDLTIVRTTSTPTAAATIAKGQCRVAPVPRQLF